MRSVRLVAVSDEYDTDPGLIIKGTPQVEGMAADRDGILLAHDLLEHVNGVKNIGQVWDELEALGALWFVRGRHGDLMTRSGSMYSPAQNVASDVTRMFLDDPECGYMRTPRTYRHDYDEDFREIIAHARHGIRQESDGPVNAQEVSRYLQAALAHMRIGFRKATKRYGWGYKAHSLFGAVRDAVKAARPEFEGQEFILRYGNGEATIREVYDESYH